MITTREQLKPEILPLQTKGIEQFTNNDYDGCIATMNIILMIQQQRLILYGQKELKKP